MDELGDKMSNFNIQKLTPSVQSDLEVLYKQVFSGHPWHEDLICKNSKKDENKCMQQYTRKSCERVAIFNDEEGNEQVQNDCRDRYTKNSDVILLTDDFKNCKRCGEPLELIEFYPEFADHRKLITEAMNLRGFTGYVGVKDEELVAFSWGYMMPRERTISVAFDKISKVVSELGINPEEVFYASETGVNDAFQNSGYGSAVSGKRILDAEEQEYHQFLTRTKNPFVHKMFRKFFGGKKPQELFKDPERGTPWFAWNFKDLDRSAIEDKINKVVPNSEERPMRSSY